jgi:hypothetical protein
MKVFPFACKTFSFRQYCLNAPNGYALCRNIRYKLGRFEILSIECGDEISRGQGTRFCAYTSSFQDRPCAIAAPYFEHESLILSVNLYSN